MMLMMMMMMMMMNFIGFYAVSTGRCLVSHVSEDRISFIFRTPIKVKD